MADKEVVPDLYGFELRLTLPEQAVRLQCDGAARRSEAAWAPFIQQTKLPAETKLKELIRMGVPPTLRPWVWAEASGAAARKAAVGTNYFSNMVLAGSQSKYLKEIQQDAAHTMPNHPWLHSAEGQAALVKVLCAYSVHNERVGYCRSMNHIVGMLLVCLNRNAEAAFWLLVALVEGILYEGVYSANLAGCQVEMKALDELIASKLPRLGQHLRDLDADVSIIATDWYLALFTTSLPPETVARVWDGLFNEGPKVLFRAALALLKLNEEALLKCRDAGDLLMAVRQAAQRTHDRDALMATAFDGIGSLSMAVIDKHRQERAKEVEQALAERAAMGRRQELKQTLSTHMQRSTGSQGEEDGPQGAGGREEALEVISEHLSELGRTAGVLGKQAASNVRKGFGQLMANVKDLGAKAQAGLKNVNATGGEGRVLTAAAAPGAAVQLPPRGASGESGGQLAARRPGLSALACEDQDKD